MARLGHILAGAERHNRKEYFLSKWIENMCVLHSYVTACYLVKYSTFLHPYLNKYM